MNKKEIRKLAGHKWWEHLLTKYRYVETEKAYKEYEKPRLWVVALIWLIMIALSPILIIIGIISEAKDWLCYPMGQYGCEKFTMINKENNNENS